YRGATERMMFLTRAGLLALACLIMMVFAGMAVLGVSLSARSPRLAIPSPSPVQIAAPSPAETVASRFPSADAAPPSQPATSSTASVIPVEHWEAFDPGALSAIASAVPLWPKAAETTPTASETVEWPGSEPAGQSVAVAEPAKTEQTDPAKTEPAKTEPAKGPAAGPPPPRGTSRADKVLNDAHVAHNKPRLHPNAQPEHDA